VTLDQLLSSIPPGWQHLGAEAWALTQRYNPPLRIVDAKAKWASLRVLLNPCDVVERAEEAAEARRLLRELSDRSEDTCEECGEPGRIVDLGGWFSVLCAPHEHQRRALWHP
jgi:hypothetical protein